MKNKILVCMAVIISVFVLGTAAGAGIIAAEGFSVSTGVCLFSDNGSCFVIKDNSPIKMTAYSGNDKMFKNLTDGDKIFTVHSGINETYPGTTEAFLCLKVHDGKKEDIPEDIITSLTQLGWLGTDTASTENTDTVFTKKIRIQKEFANLSVDIPEDWTYTESKETSDGTSFCVEMYKESSPQNTVRIEYRDFFGVCGTGLVTQDITISEYKASKGIYDNNPSWDYIVFEDTPGYYVIYNNTDDDWWSENGKEVMQILSTVKIAEGMVFREKALETAVSAAEGEYTRKPGEFDPENGIWTFTFNRDEAEEIIKISSTGELVNS